MFFIKKNKVGIKVNDAMTKRPITISPDINIPSCARKMLSKNVGSLIVMEGDKISGIVTEKDIVEDVVGKELDFKDVKVKDIMTVGYIFITPHSDLSEAVELMIREDVRRLLVVEDKKLLGLLTVKDILKVQPRLYEKLHPRFTLHVRK